MSKIAIIGTTTWGITLGTVWAKDNNDVFIWARSSEEARLLNKNGPAKIKRLPSNFKLPHNLYIIASMEEALVGAAAVIMAVPAQSMRSNIKLVAPYLTEDMLVISVAKGLELPSNKMMTQVIGEEIDDALEHNICVLSGPNLAWEVLHDMPAVTVVASDNQNQAKKAHNLLTTPVFSAYTNTDVIGVELGGALKNIIALAAGIMDGLDYGDNAKAALITRGLTEISALGSSMGANPLTFSGLAGLGDLIATCSSSLSRNHYVGMELTKGRSLEEITATMDNVAEGISTTKAAWQLAQERELEMPITECIYKILYQQSDLKSTMSGVLSSAANHELSGRKWDLFSFFKRIKKT
jgi:glycerol-3-phosphate dehydrogenase (NAD(P)+)